MNPVSSYDQESLTRHASFAKELISAAGNHVAQAKSLHDELEKFYITAMDFTKVDQVYKRLIDDILNK
jgi:hypothetical protein